MGISRMVKKTPTERRGLDCAENQIRNYRLDPGNGRHDTLEPCLSQRQESKFEQGQGGDQTRNQREGGSPDQRRSQTSEVLLRQITGYASYRALARTFVHW